jgi:rhamnose utilization protein RhaD (predicted bifunctional aldolase and dehydrogenase)
MKEIHDLIEISQFYGSDKRFVIAGGGNTSYKNEEKIWVKASGTSLATITEEGFAILDRTKLNSMTGKEYSKDEKEREDQVKNDLAEATLTKGNRPSVETSLHNVIDFPFVVHLHPTVVNGLLCSVNVESELKRLFGNRVLYIEYTDPGYVLFKKVNDKLKEYRLLYSEEPNVIWLQNHGLFVAADSIDEIKSIYSDIFEKIESFIKDHVPNEKIEIPKKIVDFIPAIRMMLSQNGLKTLKVRNNSLIQYFAENEENQKDINKPFTPDEIVYCKSNYLFINCSETTEILTESSRLIDEFVEKYGYIPKVLLIKGVGLVAVGDNPKQCEVVLDVFEDAMKVAFISKSFGGPNPMLQEQIDFIDNWEVENYRRSIAAGNSSGRVENRIIIITGAAQGFGEGIGRCLIKEGVIIYSLLYVRIIFWIILFVTRNRFH